MRSFLRLGAVAGVRGRTLGRLGLLGAAVALLLVSAQFATANPDHSAGDYFIFAKAAHGQFAETNCNASNDKQAGTSGSTLEFWGRIHSNADFQNSGSNNLFANSPSPNPEVTYGTHDSDCIGEDTGSGNTFAGGGPTSVFPALAHQVDPATGWPGNLGSKLNPDLLTFTEATFGVPCTVGSLTTSGDLVINTSFAGPHYNQVVCRNSGKITINVQNAGTVANPFKITLISHGVIEVSGQNAVLAPADGGHGVLAATDVNHGVDANGIKLSGSNLDVPRRAILFTPRTGQDVSGSDDSTLCIQLIGQEANVAGSNSQFGPFLPDCGAPTGVVTEIHASVGGDAHVNLGDGLSAVELGTEIHDKVVVSSSSGQNLTGTITLERFDNGTCSGAAAATAAWSAGAGPPGPTGGTYAPATTVTIDPALPFTPGLGVYSYRASYSGDGSNDAAVGICEGPVHVVDASVAVTPATDANEAGDDHDLTVTVSVQGGAIATGGAAVTATKQSGPGFLDPGACTTPAGASPQSCVVTLKSNEAGTTVVAASASIPIDVDGNGTADVTLVRGTGTTAETGAATKTWVKVRISISPVSDANEVGSDHVLTIRLEQSVEEDVWTALAGETVSATLANTAGATADFVGGDSCETAADGTCTVTISSPTAGTTTVEATWAGGTVAGAVISGKTTDPNASKTWVAVRISISPLEDANEVGSDHELLVTLEQSVESGVWSPLAGETVSGQLTNSAGATAVFVGGDSCVTAADGTCTLTINSPTAGLTTVEASWAGGTVAGAQVSAKSTQPDAEKRWVAVRISISPLEDANEVGSDHELLVTLEQSLEAGVWSPLAGETVSGELTNSDGATAAFVGGNSCVTAADGTCTLTINSPTAGLTTVEASWAGGTVAGAQVSAKTTQPDAEKRWVAVRISISPLVDTNPVGSNHELLVTLEQSVAAGAWSPLADETVTGHLTNSAGATAVFVGGDSCVTAADGTCTLVISSPTPGTTTVEATWAGGAVAGAVIGGKATDPDAVKHWAAVKIEITPSQATNEVGDPHTFVVTVSRDTGSGYEGVQGVHVDFTLTASNGASAVLDAAASTCDDAGPNTDANGQCTIVLVSPTAGKVTAVATATVPINGATVTVSTDGSGDSSGPAVKTYVDARISITPLEDVNPIDAPHVFTAHVTVNRGDGDGFVDAPDGTEVSFAKVSGPGSFTTANPCTTSGGTGTCTVTLVSSTPGTTVVSASTDVTVGGETLSRSTNGQAGNSGPAQKEWRAARILIGPSAVNEVGDPHTFTATVERDNGSGYAPVQGVDVTITLTAANGAVPSPAGPVVCTTNAAGQCGVTFTSATPGLVTGHASAAVPVNGAMVDVETDGKGDNSDAAVKRFVDARIAITPESAVNPVNTSHVFTATVTVNRGDGNGYVNAPDGTEISFTKVAGPGSFTTANPCTTSGGTCTVTLTSPAAGLSVVSASTTVSVNGLALSRSTNGQAGSSGPAEKQWAAVRVLIGPDDVNPVGEPHTFTATVQQDTGAGFAPIAGQAVTITLTGSNGAAPSPAGPVACTTNASGQCSATFTSATAGIVTGNAGATVTIPGHGPVTVTTNGVAPSSGPAVKRFVDARIGLTPLTAVNPVNTNHVFTATVTVNAGDGAGFVPAPNGTQVAFTLVSGPGSFTTPTTCATVAGTCTITLRSAVAGTSLVSASTTATVQGVALARSTNGQAGNSGPAEKEWVVFTPPATCQALTATPRSLQAGRRATIVARVRLSNGRPMARARVRVTGPGINVTRRTNAQGVARIAVRPTRAGIARIQVVGSRQCQTRRGIIGVFRPPPLTG